jgi:hypothetical protein
MSEEGEMWAGYREERRAKKHSNEEQSLAMLRARGIEYETLNAAISHYRVGKFNFWPTTGKFYNPQTGQKGRGVKNLIKITLCQTRKS